MASSPITSWQVDGETMQTVTGFISLGCKMTANGDCSHEIKRCSLLGRRAMTNLDSRDMTLPRKVHISQSYSFSSSHVWIWELDHKEGWISKKWCFWTVVLEKTLESPLDCKETKPVNPKGNQFWIFIGMTDAEAEAPILRPPDANSWFIGKDLDFGKDGWQEEKGMTENAMIWCHHWPNGHEFEQAPGDDEGQGSPACCSPWGRKESNMTEWLNNNNDTREDRLLYSKFTDLNVDHIQRYSSRWYIKLTITDINAKQPPLSQYLTLSGYS